MARTEIEVHLDCPPTRVCFSCLTPQYGAFSHIRTTATLADALFDLGKPIVMVLYGGRPFAIPEYYEKTAAVLQVVCCHSKYRPVPF